MYTTYHLTSAQDANTDILDAIKIAFKNKAITIIVEEKEDFELSTQMKTMLDERLAEDEKLYLTGNNSIKQLHKKYGI